MKNTRFKSATKPFKFGIDYFDPEWNEPECVNIKNRPPRRIIGGSERVIPAHHIIIKYDYPLGRPMYRYHYSKGGYTRTKLYNLIREDYFRIYEEHPENTWGHYIGDLYLEGVTYYPSKHPQSLGRGACLVTLTMGS